MKAWDQSAWGATVDEQASVLGPGYCRGGLGNFTQVAVIVYAPMEERHF